MLEEISNISGVGWVASFCNPTFQANQAFLFGDCLALTVLLGLTSQSKGRTARWWF